MRLPDKQRLESAGFWIAFLAGLGAAVWTMLQSSGTPLHEDEIKHFLISRDVWSDPKVALSPWGRCLNTLIYVVPAAFGLEAARYLSLGLTGASTVVTWLLAQRLSLRSAWLVPLFFWFQPWLIEYSFTCLTEIPFLLFLLAGLYCAVSQRETAAALLVGCLPLIRHEGMGIAVVALAYWLLLGRPRPAAIVALPYALYAVSFFGVLGAWPISLFAETQPYDVIHSGGWLHFFPPLAASAGVVLFAALYGLPRLVRTNAGLLIVSAYMLYSAMHIVIFRFGLFGSAGYVEFLLPLVPVFALAAVAGVDAVTEELAHARWNLPWGRPLPTRLIQTSAVGILMLATAAYTLQRSHPHVMGPVESACIEAAAWLRENGLSHRPIQSTNVWFYYALPLPVLNDLDRPLISPDSLPRGAIVVWDRKYSDIWGHPISKLRENPQRWRELERFGPADEAILFERL